MPPVEKVLANVILGEKLAKRKIKEGKRERKRGEMFKR
jgi:hypothetical protein